MDSRRLFALAFAVNAACASAAFAAADTSPLVARGEPLVEAVAIGLVISLAFSETLGLATGGMIVPGYIALILHRPERVAGTVAVALATWVVVRFLGRYMLVYGRRRTVLIMLVAFSLGWLSRLAKFQVEGSDVALATIGFIIPGLVADWMERQGIIQTLSSMLIASVFVRLILIAIGPQAVF
jgi:poly-gamma-glutamate biosynthesis protein PgsC/CapC